jgi:site-specific DNA recombinase
VYTCFTASRPKGPVNVAKKKPMAETKRAAIMVRRSKKDRGRMESIPYQIAALKEYAERYGYEVVAVYKDDGRPGTNTNRPGLQMMFEDAKTGAFQYVLVWKLDRVSRKVSQSIEIEEYLKSYGVQIISATEYCNDGTISAKMTKLYANVKAELDIDYLRENTMRGLLGNAEANKTCGGRAALGYFWDKKKLRIDPFAADAVRKAFAMYAEGFTKNTICETLNNEGYRTNTGKNFVVTSFDTLAFHIHC